MPETPNEKNLREFRTRLESNSLDKLDETRIANFIARYPSKHWTREQVIEDCLANEKLCAKMAKDPTKQNLDEKDVILKIGATKLPSGGSNNIRFRLSDGELVKGIVIKGNDENRFNYTKSADFVLEYNGKTIYGAQKKIHGSGGSQDNQVLDAVLNFVDIGNKIYNAIAVIDGANITKNKVYTSDEIVEKKNKNEDL